MDTPKVTDQLNYTTYTDDQLNALLASRLKQPIRQWAQDWNEAITLVEAYFRLTTVKGPGDGVLWAARFGLIEELWGRVERTPARAICVAWLIYDDWERDTDNLHLLTIVKDYVRAVEDGIRQVGDLGLDWGDNLDDWIPRAADEIKRLRGTDHDRHTD